MSFQDGAAEISEDFIDLLDGWMDNHGTRLYAAMQMRAMVYIPELNATCLCKGMLHLNPNLPPRTMLFPASTIKMKYPGISNIPLGIDIVKTTKNKLSEPMLTPCLASVLFQRVQVNTDDALSLIPIM